MQVQKAVHLATLDEAFDLLATLDDPIDQYEALQKLCRRSWLHGVHIDDYYYDIKRLVKDALADNNLVCKILLGQLPKAVKLKAKEDYTAKTGDGIISDVNARQFLTNIKSC